MPSSPNLKVDVRVIPLVRPYYRRPIGRMAVGLAGSTPQAGTKGACKNRARIAIEHLH